MRIVVHSGTATGIGGAVQAALAHARGALAAERWLYPEGLGAGGQGDLLMAALPLGEAHPLAAGRGLDDPVDLQDFSLRARTILSRQIVAQRPRGLVLSLPEAALWCDGEERLSALHRLLSDWSDDITAILHLAHPAEALADAFTAQVMLGRQDGLASEAAVAADPAGWWAAATAARAGGKPSATRHPLLALPSPAVDGAGLAALWARVFGADAVLARELPLAEAGQPVPQAVLNDLALPVPLDPPPLAATRRPSSAALSRALTLNRALAGVEGPIPMALREPMLARLWDDRAGLAAKDVAALTAAIRPLSGGRKTPLVLEADDSFDPAPLMADLPQAIARWQAERDAARKARSAAMQAPTPPRASRRPAPEPLSPAAETILSATAKEVLKTFAGGRFWPHNQGIVGFDETQDRPPFDATPAPKTNTLILGCMKNEGPYILEWIAYHQAIGVGHFLIFTNDCSDGTDTILDRLAEMGIVTHERNDEWKGKSPQQAALNKAMKLDVVKRADWLIHIDVDEYINIRLGDGTMPELLAAMGDATNLAMTWRLFGNAGLDGIADASVIDRFTGCSPTYCPKPHTMWGFKSMTRNAGVYEKLSCHRPNHLTSDGAKVVKWLNGSLKDATKELAQKGWRNSIQSIGFDAVQLNHYALRSRESFLIKRQRGRALHVDRSIGLNYWVRHDWSRNTDRTILRQVPRMQAAKAALLADPVLARLQDEALAWHHAKAAELKEVEAFRALWDQTREAELTDAERMAYAVAEDMES